MQNSREDLSQKDNSIHDKDGLAEALRPILWSKDFSEENVCKTARAWAVELVMLHHNNLDGLIARLRGKK